MPSRKVLKGVARIVADSFTSLMNYRDGDYIMGHLLCAALATGYTEFDVDLMTGSAQPPDLLRPPVRESVQWYCSDFPALVARNGSDVSFVSAARMSVSFETAKTRSHAGNPRWVEAPYLCRVSIVDDRGKEYSAEVDGWWYPEQECKGD